MRNNVDVGREWLHLISGVIAGAGVLFASQSSLLLLLFLFFQKAAPL